jgi:hypothetical protein
MDLLGLILLVIIVIAVVWGGFWICDRAGFPIPVKWIWGAICLIVLLILVLGQIGGGINLHAPLWHRG